MADLARLVLEVDSKGVVSGKIALDQLTGSAAKAQGGGKSLMDTFRNMQAIMQGPIAAFNAAKAAISSAYSAMDSLIMAGAGSEKAISDLSSVLASTGGVAGYTRTQLVQLAESFAENTLFEDEDFEAAETALARFKVASGKTFKEIISLSADLAQVGGGSVAQYSQAIGKAMRGEEEGLTMLKRANVVLSNSQTELAKTYYAAGNEAAAYRVILDEVTSQVGGAAVNAAQTATAEWQQMKIAFGEVQEAYGILVAELAKPIVIPLTKELNNIASIISGRTALQNVLDSLKKDARGNIFFKTPQSADSLESATAFAESEIARLRSEHPVIITSVWRRQNEERIETLKKAIELMEPYLERLKAIEAAENAARIAKEKEAEAARKATAAAEAEQKRIDGIRGYDTSYQYEGAGLEQIDIINAVIQKEQEEKALREANAESVAEYWANYIYGCEQAAKAEEALADAAKKAREQNLDKVLKDLTTQLNTLMSSVASDAFLGLMEGLGAALAGSATAGKDMADMLADLGARILDELPRMLLYAGIQAMAYSPEVGIALIAASGLVALGAGIVSYYSSQNETAATEAAASTVAATRRSSSPVSVSLINSSGVQMTATATETSDGAGGRMIAIELNKVLRSAVASGSLDTAMRGRYGLAAQGIRKG